MKLNAILLQQRLLLFLLFACVATALLAEIGSNTYAPSSMDIYNHLAAMMQAKMALAEGQFPLRVAPLDGNGWWYPSFQFYSSSSYTLAGLIYRWITPSNPYIAYKLTIWCALIVGGIYMNRLAYWLVKSGPAAILAGVAYLMAPYYIVVINHMGAFNEAIALGILPAALYYTFKCYYHDIGYKRLLQVGLVWYLLATIHLITFFYTSCFVAILLLLITYKNFSYWKNLIVVGVTYVFGCCLAMWALAPSALFGKYFMMARQLSSSAPNINAHRSFFSYLFSPAVNISGGWVDPNGVTDLSTLLHPSLGMPILLAVGVCCYALWNNQWNNQWNKQELVNQRADDWLIPLLMTFFLVFVAVWTPINFWEWVPQYFVIFQYTWRFLSQAIWIGALLLAWALCWLFRNKLDVRHTVLGILLIVNATSDWLPIKEYNFSAFSEAIKHSILTWNTDSYLLDAETHPQLIQFIDNISLDFSIKKEGLQHHYLKFNSSHSIPRLLLDKAAVPVLMVRGLVTKEAAKAKQQQFNVIINDSIIATYPVKPGNFQWDIPLATIKKLKDKFPILSLQFKVSAGKNNFIAHPERLIEIERIALTGFVKPSETFAVTKVESLCHQQKTIKVCHIEVPSATRVLELPVFYYPNMLNITLNGKPAPYFSVLYQDHLIAGIVPKAGAMNDIQIEFRGLLWANFISSLAWGLWGLLFLFIVLRRCFLEKKRAIVAPKNIRS